MDESANEPAEPVDHKPKTRPEPKRSTITINNRILGYSLAGLLAAFVIFMFGTAVGHWATVNDRRAVIKQAQGPYGPGFGGGRRFRTFGPGGMGMMNTQNRISGVVTNVNGDTFTVAGNGTTNSVTTTSSTQYTNGSKVAVNDSVVVIGSTSNGTFTATQVIINSNPSSI